MSDLARIANLARSGYVHRIAGGPGAVPWWTAVLITASSARQAERYHEEIRRRCEDGKVPGGVFYLAVPDPDDQRIGSGGATFHALRQLAERTLCGAGARGPRSLASWWAGQRVLIIHSGGDSRRLPQYSLAGKLFSALPVKTPWRETSTVFDEFLALSTPWAQRLAGGLVVASGDVILTFDAAQLDWERRGVCGVAIRQPVEVGTQHGVYIADERGRVHWFLQKPTLAQVQASGGLLPEGNVAVDSGLLRFAPDVAARLMRLAGVQRAGERWELAPGILDRARPGARVIDLYEHVTLALTGQWRPERGEAWSKLADVLYGLPFWCSVVDGDFTHVGTTRHFRRLITEETGFTERYAAEHRLDTMNPPEVSGSGVLIDSALAAGGELGAGVVAIECDLETPVQAAAGAMLHGLTGIEAPVEVPRDTVVHQVPVALTDGVRGVVIRVYGVEDDPKAGMESGHATWFGRPLAEACDALGLDHEDVWAGIPAGERSLWNARLFPVGSIAEAWDCARWMMQVEESYAAERWRQARRLSLAESAQWADTRALDDARTQRLQTNWRLTAVSLAKAGTDIRPLLAHAPGIPPLAATGRSLAQQAAGLEPRAPTESASQYFQASLFLRQAGLAEEAERARGEAFAAVRRAVDAGTGECEFPLAGREWRYPSVSVSAPPRLDLGGGWSDTPPFCLDWGGTVLNMAVELNGAYPIRTMVRRLDRPVVRCVSRDGGESAEFRSAAEILAYPSPGSPFSISLHALRMAGVVQPGECLERTLERLGGGVEIETEVDLPMGSGLGTSSILAATVVRALAEMLACPLTDQALSNQVMCLEQRMTTGGGWQDQVGGIFPGVKLALSGPGLRQRVRVEPIGWSARREAEFLERFVLYYTGIRRLAKDLLAQVVSSYLAREVATVQVLHSIKTLALEMAYALRQGEWDYLGQLIARHWELNQVLDPHTSSAPINSLLRELRPHLAGAKLAGAGGGGFLMLLARSAREAAVLRERLAARNGGASGKLCQFRIAHEGLRVTHGVAAG
ncbi:MAG TPA: bifunctional fucokinase/fucose-1-phosphate guanylyltransferase [Bryobacteraceae bacterium]|nr:bifunctional fucokinase/fucose-1-phosphate guanylyltransferase [Bryobacteraceae bacterium]